MTHWATDAIFYHIYPLGLCNAPHHNDFGRAVEPRLETMYSWLDHLQSLGVTGLYLGPLFESTSHGYDTADYYRVDRRLGDNTTLTALVAALHDRGIRVILDGVFHHVGRDFWAFRDLQSNGQQSRYRDWFVDIDFSRRSPYGDPFSYAGWSGHYDLVKLNLANPEVLSHLFGAIRQWMDEFAIDGLRLDVADALDTAFLHELALFCHSYKPDFWLLGEAIHGDYRRLVNPQMLDSVTNYECYKGLYSSLNDKNYFEIAYALNRQFGTGGIYAGMPLYAFADNHDVSRVASSLTIPAHLYPLYALLFTMPGVPSIYYGSEWGLRGLKQQGSDWALRPPLTLSQAAQNGVEPDLAPAITRFANIRRQIPALRRGTYQQLSVASEQLAFARQYADDYVVVMLNQADKPVAFDVAVPFADGRTFVDALEPQQSYRVQNGRLRVTTVPSCWARILELR